MHARTNIPTYQDINNPLSSPKRHLLFDGKFVDAFDRLRVAQPAVLFASSFQHANYGLVWDFETANGGVAVHRPDESAIELQTSAAIGSSVLFQTKEYFKYQPGKSHYIAMTFVFAECAQGNVQRVGYFDDENGVFIKRTHDGIFICLRSSSSGVTTDLEIPQSEWNIDIFDGTGDTRIVLDPTLVQILVMDFQWLGAGRVRVGFDIGGKMYFVHAFLHANLTLAAYMTSANLPVRYESVNEEAAAGPSIMKGICQTVISEGGRNDDFNFMYSASNRDTLRSVAAEAQRFPLLSIRPQLEFFGRTNHISINPFHLIAFSRAHPLFIEILYDAEIIGGTWESADSGITTSSVEYNISATSVTGGHPLTGEYLSASSQGNQASPATFEFDDFQRIPLALTKGGRQITLTICATGLGANGGVTLAGAGISWKETG